jgi:hypothetical protein
MNALLARLIHAVIFIILWQPGRNEPVFQRSFHFSISFRPALRATKPPIQSMGTESYFRRVKWRGREAKHICMCICVCMYVCMHVYIFMCEYVCMHLPPTIAEVKKEESIHPFRHTNSGCNVYLKHGDILTPFLPCKQHGFLTSSSAQ